MMLFILVAGLLAVADLYVTHPRLAIALYLLTLPAFPFYWAPIALPALNYLTVQQAVSIGLLLGFQFELWGQLRRRQLNQKRLTAEALVFAMLLLWSLSGFGITTFTAATRQFFFSLLDYWVPFVLAIRNLATPEKLLPLYRWITYPAVAVGGLTLFEYIVQEPVAWNFFSSIQAGTRGDVWMPTLRAGVLRVQATFGQSIFLGFYLACAAMLALIIATRSRGVGRVGSGVCAIFLALASFLPMARGSMIGLSIVILVLLLFAKSSARWVIVFGSAMFILFFVIAAPYVPNIANFWNSFVLTAFGGASGGTQASQLANLDYRWGIVGTGLNIIDHAPILGYGDVSVNGTWPIPDVANVFLEVGLISGPLGLIAFVIFVARFLFRLNGIWQEQRGTENRYAIIGLICVYVLILVSWLDSSWPGQFAQLSWLFLGVVGGWRVNPSKNLVVAPSYRYQSATADRRPVLVRSHSR